MRPAPNQLALLVSIVWLGLLHPARANAALTGMTAALPAHSATEAATQPLWTFGTPGVEEVSPSITLAPAAVPLLPQWQAAAEPPVADASDWGTESVPGHEPVPGDEKHRAPAPTRPNIDVPKRGEFDLPELALVDDPPPGSDDDRPRALDNDDRDAQAAPTVASPPAPAAARMPPDAIPPGASMTAQEWAASNAALEALVQVLTAQTEPESPAPPMARPNHADKILSTLSAVLSGGPVAPPPAPQRSHSDEVLHTLATVLDAKRAGPDRSGAGVDLELPLEAAPAPASIAAKKRARPFGETAVAMNEAGLDEVRGGFEGEGGLRISFGIEKAVYINGSLVATTSMNVSQLGAVSAGRGAALPVDAGGFTLVQSGPGNSFTPATLGSSSIGTVIQNSLDNQKIQSVTVVNATVNSLAILRSMNTQANLRSAVIDSLRR